jgi:hypothetical protein
MLRSHALAAGTILVAGLAAVACSNAVTSPGAGTTSATAAAQFNRMGDSVLASGGTAGDAAPFYGAAGVIGQSPNVATITVSVDGASVSMSAVAVAMEVFGGPLIACPVPPVGSGTAAPFVCPWGIPRVTRTLFAWTPAKPTLIVTLVASSDTGSIGTPIPILVPGTATPVGVGTTLGTMVDSGPGLLNALTRPIPAHLEYGDGTHTWWGVSGTQSNSVKPKGGACPAPPTATTTAPRPGAIPAAVCQLADFTFSFSGVVGAPPVAIRNNTGVTGTHTVGVTGASLTGVYFKLALAMPVTHP